MRKLPLALAFCLASRFATAQEAKTAIVPEKVTYSRAIPKGLRAFVPRGGKTRFWGATKLQFEGQQIWVHVYDVRKVRYPKDEENLDAVQKSGLDLFVLSKPRQLQRISSTRFDYKRYGGYNRGGDSETVGVETLWLDPNERKKPVIRINLNNPNALYGTITQDVLVVFSQNLKKAIVQVEFGQGSSNGAGWNSWYTSFGVDEKGVLIVIYSEGSSSGERSTTYTWKDNLFRPDSRIEKKGLDEDIPYLPVPLTGD